MVAGEASGDLQGALLVTALRREFANCFEKNELGVPELDFWGACGSRMREAGVEQVVDIRHINVMGFVEVFSHYDALSREFRKLEDALLRRKPHVVILIDYPGFNLKFAQRAHAMGCVVIFHIAPKVWAHGLKRVELLRMYTHLVTCLLPFEEEFFAQHNVNAVFIGNPVATAIAQFKSSPQSLNGASSSGTLCIGLLPGSRKSELQNLLPLLLQAAFLLEQAWVGKENFEFLLPIASTFTKEYVQNVMDAAALKMGLKFPKNFLQRVLLCEQGTYPTLAKCHYAWVCSGTATLETALMGVPFSVVYKMGFFTYEIAKRLVNLPYVSLANLCAQKLIAKEFIQHDATPMALAEHALAYLQNRQGCAEAQRSEMLSLSRLFARSSVKSEDLAARTIVNLYAKQRMHN